MERWNSSKLKQQIRRLDIQTVTRLIATDTGLEKSIGYFLRVFSLQNLVVYRVVWFPNLLAFSKSDGDPVYVSRYKYLVISWQFIFHGGLCWISFAINIIWQRHVVYRQFRNNQSSFIGKRWRSVPPSCSICCHILRCEPNLFFANTSAWKSLEFFQQEYRQQSENTKIQSENAHLPRQVKTSGIRICSWLAVILNVHSCPCCTAANCRNSWIYFFILWNANFVQCIKFCSTRFYQTRFRVHFCHARLAQQLMLGLRLVTVPNRK